MLELENIHVYYGESHVLHGVSLSVAKGEVVCLLGRNGAGKTTTILTAMGYLHPRDGNIRHNGRDIGSLPPYAVSRLGVGFVPQERGIFPSLTVRENLTVFARGGDKDASKDAWTLQRIFDLFPVLKQMLKRRGGDLSGGQQQQLAIGRALVLEPKLLILDEPTEGIQPNIVHEIGDIIVRLNKEEGLAVLLVEQKLPFARRVATEFCIVANGRRVAAGVIDELTDQVVREHLSV